MTAYMPLNGVPATGSRWLFTDVLRDAWGFQGFAVSDANAVRNMVTHEFAADLADAGARAITAGIDMEMAMTDPAYAHLPEALEGGAVSGEAIDASVRRVLEAKVRMGLFDTRTWMRSGRGRCWPIRNTGRWPGSLRNALRYSSATKTICYRSTLSSSAPLQ
jgi:beta-glucosidase-like glycosyl hydrolase